jgi:gliding motility-associated-like protein
MAVFLKYTIWACCLWGAPILAAQSFQKAYFNKDICPNPAFNKVAEAPSGRFFCTTDTLIISCIDASGVVIWICDLKKLPIANIRSYPKMDLATMPDSGVLISIFGSSHRPFLFRLSASGQMIWAKEIFSLRENVFVAANEGGIILSGVTQQAITERLYPSFLKMTFDGVVLWQKLFEEDHLKITQIQVNAFNRFILGMYDDTPENQAYQHLVEITNSGQIVLKKSIKTPKIFDILPMKDGKLACLSQSPEPNSPEHVQISLFGPLWQEYWTRSIHLKQQNIQGAWLSSNMLEDSLVVLISGYQGFEKLNIIKTGLDGQLTAQSAFLSFRILDVCAPTFGGCVWVGHGETGGQTFASISRATDQFQLAACQQLPVCGMVITTAPLQTAEYTWVSKETNHKMHEFNFNTALLQWEWFFFCPEKIHFEPYFTATDTSPCVGVPIDFIPNVGLEGHWQFTQAQPPSFEGVSPWDIVFFQAGPARAQRIVQQADCSLDTAYLQLNVQPQPVLQLPELAGLCKHDSLWVSPAVLVSGAKYRWENQDSLPQRWILEPGLYTLQMQDENDCIALDSIEVIQTLPPTIQISGPPVACKSSNTLLQLLPQQQGFLLQWNTGAHTADIVVDTSGWYTVTVTDGPCMVTASHFIDIETCPDCHIYLPNVFSPSQSENNHWKPQLSCQVLQYSLRIFDRWGNLLFSSTNPDEYWDGTYQGKAMDPAVFVCQVRIETDNGFKRFIFEEVGDLTLVR